MGVRNMSPDNSPIINPQIEYSKLLSPVFLKPVSRIMAENAQAKTEIIAKTKSKTSTS